MSEGDQYIGMTLAELEQRIEFERREDAMNISTCIGCGCDDLNACEDPASLEPCHWVRLDRGAGLGVCSCCTGLIEAWDAGDRVPRAPGLNREHIDLDLRLHLYRQRNFSLRTFGPGVRTAGLLDHIRKELLEIEANPGDVYEWIDVVLLALDGAWRAGHEPEAIVRALADKQTRNEARTWPDWRTVPEGKAIEHERDAG